MISGFQLLLKSAKHCFRTIMQRKLVASTLRRAAQHGAAISAEHTLMLLRQLPLLLLKYSVWQKGNFLT